MRKLLSTKLSPKKRYLQIALNSTLADAQSIISQLPLNDRIIIEAGTPLIKHYGMEAIQRIRVWHSARQTGIPLTPTTQNTTSLLALLLGGQKGVPPPLYNLLMKKRVQSNFEKRLPKSQDTETELYIVADLKTMDRGETEVKIAASAGANAVIALGSAPTETLDAFINACERLGVDPMIDMMNVEYPLAVLRKLKRVPPVIILHRGVDEESFNREKQIPYHEIKRIKGAFDVMIAIAGGDTVREVQRSFFNDADIAVIWKSVYQSTHETVGLIEGFLKEIK